MLEKFAIGTEDLPKKVITKSQRQFIRVSVQGGSNFHGSDVSSTDKSRFKKAVK